MVAYLFMLFVLPAGAAQCTNEPDLRTAQGVARYDDEVASARIELLQTQIKKKRQYVDQIPDPTQGCESPSNPPAARRVAWFHPPKTGSSFGTTLVHYANESLPADARMSACSMNLSSEQSLKKSLLHPYEPHTCRSATDYFYIRYPYDTWFRGVFWKRYCDFGGHAFVMQADYDLFKGDFFALFRDPFKLTVSQYIRVLDNTAYVSIWNGLDGAQQFLADVGLDSSEEGVSALQNGSFHNLSEPSNAAAMLYWAEHVQGPGMVTRMLSRQSSDSMPRRVKEEDLHVATDRLRNGFRFIGMTDDFSNSICLFHLMFGGACGQYEIGNMRPTTTGNTTQASQLLQSMGYTDPFDLALYREARTRYASDLNLFGFSTEACHAIGCSI